MSENVKKTIDFKTAFSYIDDIWRFLISKNIFANEYSAELDSIKDLLICEKIKLAKNQVLNIILKIISDNHLYICRKNLYFFKINFFYINRVSLKIKNG